MHYCLRILNLNLKYKILGLFKQSGQPERLGQSIRQRIVSRMAGRIGSGARRKVDPIVDPVSFFITFFWSFLSLFLIIFLYLPSVCFRVIQEILGCVRIIQRWIEGLATYAAKLVVFYCVALLGWLDPHHHLTKLFSHFIGHFTY